MLSNTSVVRLLKQSLLVSIEMQIDFLVLGPQVQIYKSTRFMDADARSMAIRVSQPLPPRAQTAQEYISFQSCAVTQ